ncbi:MAG: DUF6029 family protein [Bacteroidetes bacterium]|nr:DUF6029 family protein [Bacteroidota bacterium]
MKKALLLIPTFLVGFISFSFAQTSLNNVAGGQIHGNFEFDGQYYYPDSLIGADTIPEKALMNGWGNINYTNGNFSAGIRYETYLNHLNGFPDGYKGTGIPYKYATYNNDKLEITVGSSYEQFGSGLILRSYEERALGIDNAIEGMRVRYSPYKGIYTKGVWGKQRNFMSTGAGIVRGVDGEINMNELFDSCMANIKTQVIVGGSFVSKFQADQDPFLVLPQNVGAWSARTNIIRNKVNFSGEYAYKINDPSAANGFIYKPGQALFSSLTYSQKGLGIYLGLLRVDNFSFRSDRTASLTQLSINSIPALTKQHTYALAAYYPFASQPNGQISWQAEISKKLKKGSKLGGKYGTDISINYSAAYGLDTTNLNDMGGKRLGYTSKYLSIGDTLFYQDVNVEIFRKINSHLKGTLLYGHFIYNKNVLEGKSNYPYINADVVVLDVIWKLSDKLTLRSDAEHLLLGGKADNKEDHGNWASLLEELSIGDHFFVAAMDQYNYGNPIVDHRVHYFSVQGGFSKGTNRIVFGYGKQRQGIFCVGGVCRQVPASNGFTLTITSSF